MSERQKATVRRAKKAPILLPRQLEYASQSLREATEKLVDLSEKQKGGQLTTELCDVVYVLKTQRLRSAANAHAFRTCGGVKALMRLLRLCVECEGKAATLVLGTLGNLCALEAATRTEVAETALPDIVGVLEHSSSSASLNTSARVIGNLALDEANISVLRELGMVRKLNHVLTSHTADSGCKQSALRSLRILCSDTECQEELKTSDGLLALSACLNSEDEAIVLSALQVVVVLTQNSDPDTIQFLCSHGAIPHIVQLSGHQRRKVQRESMSVILRCCKNSDGRVALGSAGGMETLVKFLENTDPAEAMFSEVTCALCTCCRDVISRQRLRDCGGLGHLIEMLSKAEFASMHGNLLSALICYYFDENTLKFMVKRLGLLRALTYQLQEMARKAALALPGSPGQQAERMDSGEGDGGEVKGEEEEEGCEVERTGSREEAGGEGKESDEEEGSEEERLDSREEEGEGKLGKEEEGGETESISSPITDSEPHARPEGKVVPSSSKDVFPHGSPLRSVSTESEPSYLDSESHSYGGSKGQEDVDSLSTDVGSASPVDLPLSSQDLSSESETPQTSFDSAQNSLESNLDDTALDEVIPCYSITQLAISEDSIATSPPAKRPKLQLDFGMSTPMPANFIDSLLSSPNPYQSPQTLTETSPVPTELATTLETQVVLLLSRVSHLRDCLTNLASQDVLQDITGFYFSQDYPNIHVFKVLTRVFMNPHCFQDCLLARVPSTIYRHLSLPDAICCPEQQPPGVLATTAPGSSPSSAWSSRPATPLSISCYSPTHFSPVVTPDASRTHGPTTTSPSHVNAEHMFYSMSWELLERLSKVAESPYGQGVLAHMLLRGERKERQASCLAIPILCRSTRICHKLMSSYKGLELLTALATNSSGETDSELQMLAIDSFLRLASNLERTGLKRKRSISEDLAGFLPPVKSSRVDSRESTTTNVPSTSAGAPLLSCEVPTPRTLGKFSTCRYHDSDHYPFDLILRVSDGCALTNPLQLPVHREILRESSDVFSVMLGEQYRESAETEVDIRDVPPTAMRSIVHHLYGCGWLCPSVLEEVTKAVREDGGCEEEEEDDKATEDSLASAMTEAIIEEAISIFDFHEDRQLARHSLEVLATAGRFLLCDLCAHCELFAASYISPKNVVPAFHFAQLHQSSYLAQRCIRQVVGMPHSQLQREVFRDLISSAEGTEALGLFEAFITTRLSS